MLNHYFYSPLSVQQLSKLVEGHQEEFDIILGDTFSDEELLKYEPMIDAIAAVYVQPILTELTFDDFYSDPQLEEKQRSFFNSCKSCLCLENIPFFDSNPIQVSYLKYLLALVEEVLIDRGGVNELLFKRSYLAELKTYRDMDSLIQQSVETKPESKKILPVSPIDFLIQDVYLQIERLKASEKSEKLKEFLTNQNEKVQKIFHVMSHERLDSSELVKKTSLNPKDFDDNLEKLKFLLKKLP